MGLRSHEYEDTKTNPPRHMLAAGVPILGDTIYPTILTEDAANYSRPIPQPITPIDAKYWT
ncbi:hypothetical protein FRC0406_02359 [Corynebacterium diphtheriae]|nr:hypothetical protein [Corynebacterium diphtheriae]CAB0894216.1 hypothetical protein FRC0406_02359 [Corynebacterium diphtheriae]